MYFLLEHFTLEHYSLENFPLENFPLEHLSLEHPSLELFSWHPKEASSSNQTFGIKCFIGFPGRILEMNRRWNLSLLQKDGFNELENG